MTAFLIAIPAWLILFCNSLIVRWTARKRGERPRLIFGPTPIISIKYIAEAMRRKGYEASTFVYTVYKINERRDYDYHLDEFFGKDRSRFRSRLFFLLARYYAFLWLTRRFDVFHFFFDGGFLQGTPLFRWEAWFLHLAGKKIIVMPYGSDVAIPTMIRCIPFRQGILANYPDVAANEEKTKRNIDYFTLNADFIVGCLFHTETLPRWNLLPTHYYPIDTEEWKPSGKYSNADGKNAPVVVVHSPNHRGLKGTEFLIEACNELKAEGYKIDLRLLEGIPNAEVKKILAESDILAEQFLIGYALSAMEGMALGKPVMSNLTDDYYFEVHRLYTGLDECPIVSTSPDDIKENLRELVENPDRRAMLGKAGRDYVLKYHSYETVAEMWDLIYRKVWHNEPIDLNVWHPGKISGTKKETGV